MGLRNDSLRSWILPLALALAALLVQLAGTSSREALAWERHAIGAGEAWRLVTGHIAHLGWSHLVLNVAGLALVWSLVGRHFGVRRWLVIALASVVAMDAGFWWLDPELEWYVGLSGLLHGLLAGGLYAGLLRRDRESLVLAAFVLAKLAWEQFSGPLPGSEAGSGGNVIVNAHLYGALGGLAGALLIRIGVRLKSAI